MNNLPISLEVRTAKTFVLTAAAELECLRGALWLTRFGDSTDYLVSRGESFFVKPGRWTVQALEKAEYIIGELSESKEACDVQTTVFPLLSRL